MYKAIIRPVLFTLSAERAHHFSTSAFRSLYRFPGAAAVLDSMYGFHHSTLEREVFGLRFPNPVGLAAGFDKDAHLVDEMEALGFGFVEIGTVTPKAQPGNEKPRLFRLPKDKALVNRMGFNNGGAAAAALRLRKRNGRIIIGGNIGKNKTTPNETAVADYLACYDLLSEVVDYFVVNVSSPNTPNLRDLQEKEPLRALLREVMIHNNSQPVPRPVLLKIAPDLTEGQLVDILEIVEDVKLHGLIATNTTISRSGLHTAGDEIEGIGAGGLSGKPLRLRATEVIRFLHRESGGKIPIIGVGGIFSADDAKEKLDAGASLVQLYTGFIYEGPGLIRQIKKALVNVTK